jgi:predicted ArsR family transcriptional regulator
MRPEPTDARVHAALASAPRRRVLDALTRSATPLDAQTIAAGLELHVTTVRFHLEQLEAARLVHRSRAADGQGADGRRGRPRINYVAADPTQEDSREQLIDALAGALAAGDDGGRSRSIAAGRTWADSLVVDAGGVDGAGDDEVATLVHVLDGLGFDPVRGADEIRLRACPFRDAAREHPQVVCSVHLGLVERVLAQGGGDRQPELLPFVEPEVCLITMRRATT